MYKRILLVSPHPLSISVQFGNLQNQAEGKARSQI